MLVPFVVRPRGTDLPFYYINYYLYQFHISVMQKSSALLFLSFDNIRHFVFFD